MVSMVKGRPRELPSASTAVAHFAGPSPDRQVTAPAGELEPPARARFTVDQP